MRKEDLYTTSKNETDTRKCVASLSKSTPLNPGVQSIKATAKSKWISLIAATKKTPNKSNKTTASLRSSRLRPAPPTVRTMTSSRFSTRVYAEHATVRVELEITSESFGIWRWKNEDRSIRYWHISFRSQDCWFASCTRFLLNLVDLQLSWRNLEREISRILRSEVSTEQSSYGQ